MPPVRKKAEPMVGKRPMPALDLQKLQEEKEALMKQRAAAAVDKPATENAGASGGDDVSVPATASNAPSSGATALTSASGGGSTLSSLYGSPDEEYDPAKPNDYDEFC